MRADVSDAITKKKPLKQCNRVAGHSWQRISECAHRTHGTEVSFGEIVANVRVLFGYLLDGDCRAAVRSQQRAINVPAGSLSVIGAPLGRGVSWHVSVRCASPVRAVRSLAGVLDSAGWIAIAHRVLLYTERS